MHNKFIKENNFQATFKHLNSRNEKLTKTIRSQDFM